jgi:hypothetical protein
MVISNRYSFPFPSFNVMYSTPQSFGSGPLFVLDGGGSGGFGCDVGWEEGMLLISGGTSTSPVDPHPDTIAAKTTSRQIFCMDSSRAIQ